MLTNNSFFLWLRQSFKLSLLSFHSSLYFLLGIGVFVQLSGLVFNNDNSRYATQLNLLLFLPSLLVLFVSVLSKVFWLQRSMLLISALFGWVLVYSLVNNAAGDNFLHWFKNVFYILLYLSVIGFLVFDERRFCCVLASSSLVVAVAAILTLYYQFLVLNHPLDYESARWHRLFQLGWRGFADLDHPIYAGLYYGVFSIVLTWFYLNFKLKHWQCVFLFVGLFSLLFYVLYTFSRGAWFATAFSGFMLLIFSWNKKSKILMTFGCLVIALSLFVFWSEIYNEQKIGVNGRQLIWGAWLDQLPTFWMWGNGAGSIFSFTFPGGMGKIPAGFTVNQAHSLYLQLWYEYGVVGLILFLSLLVSLFRKAWACREQPLAKLGAALLIFCMVAMVSEVHSIIMRPNPYWVVVWFPIAILLGIKKSDAKQVNHVE
ncbi:O-antigen ligase family protein [Pseudomonas sp. MS19]|uniref:O-antigen ligase family protein n=1 Tax=Pseudomonas sp. MS19 TaxID=2579939 RepID=UPI001F5C060D|nr:O-antigen ligase family protein [Pseudomonas sp. MS19]